MAIFQFVACLPGFKTLIWLHQKILSNSSRTAASIQRLDQRNSSKQSARPPVPASLRPFHFHICLSKLSNFFGILPLPGPRGVSKRMPEVIIHDDESFERALKRFKKKCEKAGILSDLRKHRHFEKPSEKRKRKMNAAVRKNRRGPRVPRG